MVSENIADWYRDTYKIARPTVVLNAPREQQVEKNDYFRETFGLHWGCLWLGLVLGMDTVIKL